MIQQQLATTLASVYTDDAASVGSSYSKFQYLTIDGKGRITAATTASISSSLTIGDGSATDVVSVGTDTLVYAGTANEIETAVTNNTVTFGLPNDVTIGNDLTVTNDMTVSGTFTSDDITSATVSVSGDAIITGNLTVQGTQTIIESTTVTTEDAVIQANSAGANTDAGFEANTASGVKRSFIQQLEQSGTSVLKTLKQQVTFKGNCNW